jgi:hypothetical protein
MSDDVVEWHTWSGTRHKFGPAQSRSHSFGRTTYRRSLCGGRHYADEEFQSRVKERRRCSRCFPPVAVEEIDALAALIHEVDGSHSLGAGALAEALHARGVRCSS